MCRPPPVLRYGIGVDRVEFAQRAVHAPVVSSAAQLAAPQVDDGCVALTFV